MTNIIATIIKIMNAHASDHAYETTGFMTESVRRHRKNMNKGYSIAVNTMTRIANNKTPEGLLGIMRTNAEQKIANAKTLNAEQVASGYELAVDSLEDLIKDLMSEALRG